jgi:hypothetical protein
MGVAAPDHRPKEVLGLAMLWFYGVLGWCSLLALIAHADIQQVFWRDLVVCTMTCFAAAHTIRKSGLLALAAGVQSDAQPTRARAWWCWLTRFKLSAAVLVVSGVASWFAFSGLLMWLVEPELRAWGATVTAPRLYFGSVHDLLRARLLLAVGFGGLAALPVLASDVWRLLTPLMSARAARLRFVFALATGVIIVSAVLLFRECAFGAWSFFGPQELEI